MRELIVERQSKNAYVSTSGQDCPKKQVGSRRDVERVLTITKIDRDEKACDNAHLLTGNERVMLVEYLRHEVSKVTKREYPQRLRRVLEVVKPGEH